MTIKNNIEKIINSKSSVNKAEAILYYLINECRVPLIDNGWLDDDDETYHKLSGSCLDITSYLKEINLLSDQNDHALDKFITKLNASINGTGTN